MVISDGQYAVNEAASDQHLINPLRLAALRGLPASPSTLYEVKEGDPQSSYLLYGYSPMTRMTQVSISHIRNKYDRPTLPWGIHQSVYKQR